MFSALKDASAKSEASVFVEQKMEINFAWGSADFILTDGEKRKRIPRDSEENRLLCLVVFNRPTPHAFPYVVEANNPYYEELKQLME